VDIAAAGVKFYGSAARFQNCNVLTNALVAQQAGAHMEIGTNSISNWNGSDAEADGLSRWSVDPPGKNEPAL